MAVAAAHGGKECSPEDPAIQLLCLLLLCLFGVSKCGDDSMAPCVTWQLCISVLDELKVHKFRTQKEMLYEKKPPICNGLRGEFSKTSIQLESIRDFLA